MILNEYMIRLMSLQYDERDSFRRKSPSGAGSILIINVEQDELLCWFEVLVSVKRKALYYNRHQ